MSVNLYNATTDTLKNVAGDIVNPKSVNNTIAPAEETTTASRAYNIGEQFFLNDVLYKATDNIAQGDTITVGTNCSASDKLTEQIDSLNNDLGSKSSASAVTGNDAFSKIATLNNDLTVLDGDITNIQNQIGSLISDGMIVKSLFLSVGYNSILLKCPSDSSTHLFLVCAGLVISADKGGAATSFSTTTISGTPNVKYTGTDSAGKTNYILDLSPYSRPLVFISSSALDDVNISPYTHS